LIVIGIPILTAYYMFEIFRSDPATFWSTSGVVPGTSLIISFLVGVAIYLYRDLIPWDRRLGWILTILGLGMLYFPLGQFVAVFPLAYTTVFFGLENPRKLAVLKGDYSYGVYINGFVVQQVFTSLGPWTHHWWLNIGVCVPVTLAVAVLSWNFVEKPALGWRTYLARLEKIWLSSALGRHTRSWLPATREPADLGPRAPT
jgi:peptidoglycan/LPS O-acetylase OafA/YrhL